MASQVLEFENPRVVRIRTTGWLSGQDYDTVGPELVRRIQQFGTIHILLELEEFEGWDTSAVVEDTKLELEHGAHFGRLAVVGDPKWEDDVMNLFRGPMAQAEVRFFDSAKRDEALAWVEGS